MGETLTAHCRKRLAAGFELCAELTIPLGEAPVTVLAGASGSGKTTLLRLIAGLERPDAGEIAFRGETWAAEGPPRVFAPPQRRRAGFLFQDYALFPHLTALGNAAYAAPRAKALELLERFGIADCAHRPVRALSGGQQQRVALARALAAGSRLLLLDEPLSALDAATRLRTRQELRRLLLESGVPAIVVTHDRDEAAALGDWLAVMHAGRLLQAGPLRQVFARPATREVAETLGVENVFPARAQAGDGGLLRLDAGPLQVEAIDNGERGEVIVCIRAEDIALAPPHAAPSSARNRLEVSVTGIEIAGPLARVELDAGLPLVALITAHSAAGLALAPGARLTAIIKTTAVHLAR